MVFQPAHDLVVLLIFRAGIEEFLIFLVLVDDVEHAFIAAVTAIEHFALAIQDEFLQIQGHRLGDAEIFGILRYTYFQLFAGAEKMIDSISAGKNDPCIIMNFYFLLSEFFICSRHPSTFRYVDRAAIRLQISCLSAYKPRSKKTFVLDVEKNRSHCRTALFMRSFASEARLSLIVGPNQYSILVFGVPCNRFSLHNAKTFSAFESRSLQRCVIDFGLGLLEADGMGFGAPLGITWGGVGSGDRKSTRLNSSHRT